MQRNLPSWVAFWLLLTAVVCTIDALFIILRPHTLPGGKWNYLITPCKHEQLQLSLFGSEEGSSFRIFIIYIFLKQSLMSGSIPKAIIPPGQSPGHLTFLKMIDQSPRYMGRFQGQMPYWLGLKSQNFHNLSGIDEYGTRIKKPGQKLNINASHGSKIVMYLCWRFYSFEGFDKTLSRHG